VRSDLLIWLTIRHCGWPLSTVAILKDEGLIEAVPGRGSFVAERW